MSAHLIAKSLAATPSNGLGEAFYFSCGEHELFAWLHWPSGEHRSNIGLVICKPFGYEALCAHRSLRIFAETAAAIGVPALRFDFSGTGDSADIDPEANQIEVWSREVNAAAAELRRRTGVERVCLLGFRLGAMLATLAATRTSAIDGLILVAPHVTGRRYLREIRTARLAAALNAAPVESTRGKGEEASGSSGSMEVGGHEISAATVAELTRLDLAALGKPAVSQVLIIDRSDLPTARAWADSLSRQGVQTEYSVLPGFVEMMLTAPQFAVQPEAMIAKVREWLLHSPLASPARTAGWGESASATPRSAAASRTELSLPGESPAVEATLMERPVLFGAEAELFGIVTEPHRGETRRRAVILVNAAADYHIGAGRMYVSLARRWARRGYVVLRMDFAGIGDSATRAGRPADEVFPPAALDDMRTAIDFMRNRYGVGDITLAGLCSGGYHALRAAVAALPVNRILLVNPQNFFWKQGTTLEQLQLAEVVHNPAVYRERMLSAAAWKRMLTGEVNVWRIVKIYIHRPVLALESTCRDLARFLRIRLPNDLGWELEEIAARGVQTTMVFARGEPGINLLRIQGGSSVKHLGDRCRIHIIDSADHTFSQRRPRAILEDVLSDELFAPSRSRPEIAKLSGEAS